jgi:hypothetical protein
VDKIQVEVIRCKSIIALFAPLGQSYDVQNSVARPDECDKFARLDVWQQTAMRFANPGDP